MAAEMIARAWMRELVTAEQYATWTKEQGAGIEIVDGVVLVGPSPSKRHNRMARLLANALDAAGGPDWNADTGVDVRLQDVPLNNRRPDVTVYRADSVDVAPTRPEHVLLIVEVVSPGSETTDRIVKAQSAPPGRRTHCHTARNAPTRRGPRHGRSAATVRSSGPQIDEHSHVAEFRREVVDPGEHGHRTRLE